MAISHNSANKVLVMSDLSNCYISCVRFETNDISTPDGTVPAAGVTVTRTAAGKYTATFSGAEKPAAVLAGFCNVEESDATLTGKFTGYTASSGAATCEVYDLPVPAWSEALDSTTNTVVRTLPSYVIAVVDNDIDPDAPLQIVGTAGTVAANTAKVTYTAGVATIEVEAGAVAAIKILEMPNAANVPVLADSTDKTVTLWLLCSRDALS